MNLCVCICRFHIVFNYIDGNFVVRFGVGDVNANISGTILHIHENIVNDSRRASHLIGVKSGVCDHIPVFRPIQPNKTKQNDFDLSFLWNDEHRQNTVKLMNRSHIEFIVYLAIQHLSQLCDFGARQVLRCIHAIIRLSNSSGWVFIRACDVWSR